MHRLSVCLSDEDEWIKLKTEDGTEILRYAPSADPEAQKRKLSVIVRNVIGMEERIDIRAGDSLATLNAAIQEKMGMAAERQRLVLDGKQLEQDTTFMEWKDDTILILGSKMTVK